MNRWQSSWPIEKTIEPGLSGYSHLAVAPEGVIYCLLERDNVYEDISKFAPKYISVARFSLEWLTDGKDSMEKP